MIGGIVLAYGILIGMLIGLAIAKGCKTKSQFYRKMMTNLYVTGKVRQIAEDNDVDLEKEELELLKYISLSKKDRIKDLDDAIEAKLIDEIDEVNEVGE